MNLTNTLATLVKVESLGWLLVLLALYFRGERRSMSLHKGRISLKRPEDGGVDYRAVGAFAALKLVYSLSYLVFSYRLLTESLKPHTLQLLAASTYWILYLLWTVCVFFIMAEIVRSSLKPLPGLATAALFVFKWASIIAFGIALTAHLPIFGVRNGMLWLNEVDTSFTLCVCSFELLLLVVVSKQIRRLGMCLRSRPVGLAIGLAMIGLMDLLYIVTQNLPAEVGVWVSTVNEIGLLCAIALWVFYLVQPEPARTAHSLAPASKLMHWNEIALQFGTAGRPPDSVPFISRVESTVAAILKKHNVGNYS